MLLLHNYMLLKVKYFAADKVKSLICRVFIEAHCVKSVRIRSYSDPYSVQIWENTDQNNSEHRHFLRSGRDDLFLHVCGILHNLIKNISK